MKGETSVWWCQIQLASIAPSCRKRLGDNVSDAVAAVLAVDSDPPQSRLVLPQKPAFFSRAAVSGRLSRGSGTSS
eukprot:4230062-Prymnesium_polylepis.1